MSKQPVQVITKSNWRWFERRVDQQMSIALDEGAAEIREKSRKNAPMRKGHLRADADIRSTDIFTRTISYYKEYAEYQERGARLDGSHKVRTYSNGGGPHFLENAGKEVSDKMAWIFEKYGRRA